MTDRDAVGDLHVHTTASDGTVGVEDRIDQAVESGLDALAITDHDRVSEELTSRRRVVDGLELITGVEVRADILDTKVEILGYYVDPTDHGLQSMLERARQYRRERNEEMMNRLSSATRLNVTKEAVPSGEGSVGRPHLAQLLVENDVVPTIQAAFDRYLADDAECFVPMERVNSREVIETIAGAGGVTSLAHPGRISADAEAVEEMVGRLADHGLDAIEVWYPYSGGESRYAELGVEDADRLAEKNDLLRTGGSDCHGPGSGKFRIGDTGVPDKPMEELRSFSDHRRPLPMT